MKRLITLLLLCCLLLSGCGGTNQDVDVSKEETPSEEYSSDVESKEETSVESEVETSVESEVTADSFRFILNDEWDEYYRYNLLLLTETKLKDVPFEVVDTMDVTVVDDKYTVDPDEIGYVYVGVSNNLDAVLCYSNEGSDSPLEINDLYPTYIKLDKGKVSVSEFFVDFYDSLGMGEEWDKAREIVRLTDEEGYEFKGEDWEFLFGDYLGQAGNTLNIDFLFNFSDKHYVLVDYDDYGYDLEVSILLKDSVKDMPYGFYDNMVEYMPDYFGESAVELPNSNNYPGNLEYSDISNWEYSTTDGGDIVLIQD